MISQEGSPAEVRLAFLEVVLAARGVGSLRADRVEGGVERPASRISAGGRNPEDHRVRKGADTLLGERSDTSPDEVASKHFPQSKVTIGVVVAVVPVMVVLLLVVMICWWLTHRILR